MRQKQTKPKRQRSKVAIPSLHVKRSAELWLDIFQEALMVYLTEREAPNITAIDQARLLADAAVDEFERRWPGVKL